MRNALDNKDTGFKAIAGLRLLDSFGVELNYADHGSASLPSGIACVALVGVNCPSTTYVDATTTSAFAVGFLDFPLLDLFAKAGVSLARGEVRTPGLPSFGFSETDTNFAWGAGAQAHFGSLGARAEYERFKAARSGSRRHLGEPALHLPLDRSSRRSGPRGPATAVISADTDNDPGWLMRCDNQHFSRTAAALLATLMIAGGASVVAQTPPAAAPAAVPAAVAIPRPSDGEIKIARDSLARYLAKADARTRAVLQKYPALLEVAATRAQYGRHPCPGAAVCGQASSEPRRRQAG